jgi:hypothetical protein
VTETGLVRCPRYGLESNEPLWSLTRREQVATKVTWFDLCAACYRTVFKHEPPEQFARENLKKLWRKRGLIP